jgi:hypothetical protein
MFFEPLLTGDVWWLVVNKRRRIVCPQFFAFQKIGGFVLEELKCKN